MRLATYTVTLEFPACDAELRLTVLADAVASLDIACVLRRAVQDAVDGCSTLADAYIRVQATE
jgi:hypothetical protein